MNDQVEYQLRRAAAAGRTTFMPSIDATEVGRRIRDSLAKVYVGKNLDIAVAPDVPVRARIDEGDLMEVLGNLMDNACKWAERSVQVTLSGVDGVLELAVENDGPSIEPGDIETAMSRGGRLDDDQPGHGMGLAIVRELVEDGYRGTLHFTKGRLGGARILARLDCRAGDGREKPLAGRA